MSEYFDLPGAALLYQLLVPLFIYAIQSKLIVVEKLNFEEKCNTKKLNTAQISRPFQVF